jgi:hypothetical protein
VTPGRKYVQPRIATGETKEGEVTLLGVVLTDEDVTEWEHDQRMVSVPRADIVELRYERGFHSERPVAQALLGATLLGAGLFVAYRFLEGLLQDGSALYFPKTVAALGVVLPILGGWALVTAARRGQLLRVHLKNGDRRKLVLARPVDDDELEEFAARARDELGYSVVLGDPPSASSPPRSPR